MSTMKLLNDLKDALLRIGPAKEVTLRLDRDTFLAVCRGLPFDVAFEARDNRSFRYDGIWVECEGNAMQALTSETLGLLSEVG